MFWLEANTVYRVGSEKNSIEVKMFSNLTQSSFGNVCFKCTDASYLRVKRVTIVSLEIFINELFAIVHLKTSQIRSKIVDSLWNAL